MSLFPKKVEYPFKPNLSPQSYERLKTWHMEITSTVTDFCNLNNILLQYFTANITVNSQGLREICVYYCNYFLL